MTRQTLFHLDSGHVLAFQYLVLLILASDISLLAGCSSTLDLYLTSGTGAEPTLFLLAWEGAVLLCKSGLANYGLWDNQLTISFYKYKSLLEHRLAPSFTYLYIPLAVFVLQWQSSIVAVEYGPQNQNLKNYYLVLYRRSLPTPGLNEGAFKIMYPSAHPKRKTPFYSKAVTLCTRTWFCHLRGQTRSEQI